MFRLSWREMFEWRTPNERFLGIAVVSCLANFALFFIVSLLIGGPASAGKSFGGHYFVGDHSKFTEVNQWIYLYSYVHSSTLYVTHPIGIICYYFLYREKQKAAQDALKFSKLASTESR